MIKVVKSHWLIQSPMGCRSFLGAYEENGHEVHDGRNNLGVVSLNLPRIALEAQGNEEKFYRTLDERLALAKKAFPPYCSLRKYESSCRANSYMEGACGVRLKPMIMLGYFQNGRASISFRLYWHSRNHQCTV